MQTCVCQPGRDLNERQWTLFTFSSHLTCLALTNNSNRPKQSMRRLCMFVCLWFRHPASVQNQDGCPMLAQCWRWAGPHLLCGPPAGRSWSLLRSDRTAGAGTHPRLSPPPPPRESRNTHTNINTHKHKWGPTEQGRDPTESRMGEVFPLVEETNQDHSESISCLLDRKDHLGGCQHKYISVKILCCKGETENKKAVQTV